MTTLMADGGGSSGMQSDSSKHARQQYPIVTTPLDLGKFLKIQTTDYCSTRLAQTSRQESDRRKRETKVGTSKDDGESSQLTQEARSDRRADQSKHPRMDRTGLGDGTSGDSIGSKEEDDASKESRTQGDCIEETGRSTGTTSAPRTGRARDQDTGTADSCDQAARAGDSTTGNDPEHVRSTEGTRHSLAADSGDGEVARSGSLKLGSDIDVATRTHEVRHTGTADSALREVQGPDVRGNGDQQPKLLRMGDHDVRDRGRGQLRAEALCSVPTLSGVRRPTSTNKGTRSESSGTGLRRGLGGDSLPSLTKHPEDYGKGVDQGPLMSLITNDQPKEVEPMSRHFVEKAFAEFESADILTKHMSKILVLLGPEDKTEIEKKAVENNFEVYRFSQAEMLKDIRPVVKCIENHPGCDLWAKFSGAPWSTDLIEQIKANGGVTPGWVCKLRRETMTVLGMFSNLTNRTVNTGGTSTIEWERGCPVWNTPKMNDIVNTGSFKEVLCDGCHFGAKNSAGQPVKHAWKMKTTNDTLFQNLHGQRCQAKHYHGQGENAEELSRLASVAMKSLDRDAQKRGKTWKESLAILCQLCGTVEKEATEKEDQGPETKDDELLTSEELGAWQSLPKQDKDRLAREALKVHSNASHRPVRVLADGLRLAGAKPEVVAAMKMLRCDTCAEREVHAPRPRCVFTDPIARHPWEILGMDVKEDTDDKTQEKTKYLVMIDEVMKLARVVEIFTIDSKEHRNATTQELLKTYHDGWAEVFGDPRVLRHDAEGALMGTEFTYQLASRGIQLVPIAGEAHWQLGVPERVIKTIFETADQVQKETGCGRKEAVRRSTAAHNHVSDSYGYTPSQWAFGRQPNWYGTLWCPEDPERPPMSKVANEEFRQGLARQKKAEEIMRKANSQKELTHAKNAKYRKGQVFRPGDLVFAWRQARRDRKTDKRGHPSKSSVGVNSGQWYGPGTILGTETVTIRDTKMPGSVVWVIMNGRLWRCAPSQLRSASTIETAAHNMNGKATWTFDQIVGSIDLGQYIDVREEGVPPDDGTLEEQAQQPGRSPRQDEGTDPTMEAEPGHSTDQPMGSYEEVPGTSSGKTDSPEVQDPSTAPSRRTMRQRYRKSATKARENKRYRDKKRNEKEAAQTEKLERIEKRTTDGEKRDREPSGSGGKRRMTRKTPFGAAKVYFHAEKEDLPDPEQLTKEACLMAAEEFETSEEMNLVTLDFPELDVDEEDDWNELAGRADCYVINKLQKGRAEINERKATAEERALIKKAKGMEIEEFLKEKVVEHLQEKELKTVDPSDVMKMRFVLTWKVDPETPGGKRAKARLVVLGFQDPHLGKEETLAPTMHKRSRMLLLANAAQRGWTVEKADVKAAFLQGNTFKKEETRYALPPEELASAMGMDLKDIRPVRLCKSVYGLTRAPLDWYRKIDELLISLGGIRSAADPCIWLFHERDEKGRIVYVDDTVDPRTNEVTPRTQKAETYAAEESSGPGSLTEDSDSESSDDEVRSECSSTCSTEADTRSAQLIGSIGAHVDDFLLGGEERAPRWTYIKEKLWSAFRWTPWEKYLFAQTGTKIEQNAKTKAFKLDQNEYLGTIDEIEVNGQRKKTPDAKCTQKERTQLKGILGAILWLATQTRLDVCAEVGLLQSCACEERATVKHLLAANAVLRRAKKVADKTALRIRKLAGPLCVVGWTDASLQNRIDNGSTGGYLIGLTSMEMLDGQESLVNPISWRSFKLRRVAVSSLSAETQAMRTMEDEMHIVRLMWAEFEGQLVQLADHDEHVKTVPGIAVIDAKAIYDALAGKTQTLGLVEKRTGIELQAYKDDTARNGTRTRWVHGEANLADGFTKLGAESRLITFMGEKDFVWTIVDDEEGKSAKKRRQLKLGVFDKTKKIEQEDEDLQTLLAKAFSGQRPDWNRFQSHEPDDELWFDMAHFTEGW